MNKHVALSWFIGLALSIAGSAAFADVTLSYGGRLTEATGKPRATGVDLEFRFFHQASGGSPAANVVLEHDGVVLVNGAFQRSLTLSDAAAHTIFAAGQAVWIEVKDVTNGVTYPRQQFGVVPFALKVPVDGTSITYDSDGQLMSLSGGSGNMHTNDYDADLNDKADVADDADLLGGQPGSHYLNAANLTGTIADARIPATIARDGELPVVDGTTVAAAGAVMDGDFSSNGILTRTGVGAYAVVTDNSTNWNTAHTDRLKWDGGSVGLNASAGRSNLGLGTIATQDASAVAITGGTISGVTMTSLTSTGIDDNADALAITIDSSELVGIGTASPVNLLDVRRDQNAFTGAYVRNLAAGGNTAAFSGWAVNVTGGGGGVFAYPADYTSGLKQDRIALQANSDAAGVNIEALSAGQDIRMYAGSTTPSLVLSTDGYVGIGTASPAMPLHIDTNVTKNSGSAAALLIDSQVTGTGVPAYGISVAGPISSSVPNSALINAEGGVVPAGPGANYGVIGVPRLENSSVNSNYAAGAAFRVDTAPTYTGVLAAADGIAAHAPTLNGPNKIAEIAMIRTKYMGNGPTTNSGNTTGTIVNSAIKVDLIVAEAGAGGVLNNYGLNLTMPNGSGASGTTNNYGLHITGASAAGDLNYAVYSDTSAPSYIAGNVGLGTPLPSQGLHVHSATGNAGVTLSTLGTGANQQSVLNFVTRGGGNNDTGDPATLAWHMFARGNGYTSGAGQANDFGLAYWNGTVHTTRLLVDAPTGYVGIGTSDPTAKLHIGGTPGIDGIKFPDGSLQTSALTSRPDFRWSRSTVAHNATDAAKDAVCAGDFGTGWDAGTGLDFLYHFGPRFNASVALLFNLRGVAVTYTAPATGIMAPAGGNSAQAVPCIRAGSFVRASVSTVAHSANEATKDAICTTDYGSAYGAATNLEVTGGSSTYVIYDSGGARFPFNLRDNAANSFFQSQTGLVQYGGVTAPVYCIRID